MKTLYHLILIISCLLPCSVIGQKDKDMEKAARNAYKLLLKETDKNNDGKISKTEFFAIWKDKKVAEEKWTFWDTSRDGFITEDEYVKAVMDIGKKKKK